jgi:predicted RNA-binding protein
MRIQLYRVNLREVVFTQHHIEFPASTDQLKCITNCRNLFTAPITDHCDVRDPN